MRWKEARRPSTPSSICRFTAISGGQPYSPHNYDEKFEGTITLRRALGGLAQRPRRKARGKSRHPHRRGHDETVRHHHALPPYLPLALGAADMKLLEHVSAFTVFPNDGIRIDRT